MKLFWRLIWTVLLIVFIWIAWLKFEPNLMRINLNEVQNKFVHPKNQVVGIAYPLTSEKWTQFPVGDAGNVIRIVSNGELPLTQQPSTTDKWEYHLEYQLIDKNDQIIANGEIVQNTSLRLYYDAEIQQQYLATTFYPASTTAADARLHLINLRGYDSVQKINLRVKAIVSPLIGVSVRLYHRTLSSLLDAQNQWRRMSSERRKTVSKASVYDEALLRENEKFNLVNNLWEPIGPLGILDKDYQTKKIYIARDVENDTVLNLPEIPPTGLIIYPDHFGMIKIPAFSESIKVNWQLLASEELSEDKQLSNKGTDNHANILLQWWGHPATKNHQWNPSFDLKEAVIHVESGILQINSNRPIVVRIWMQDQTKETLEKIEITPETSYLKLYKTNKNVISYQINHVNNENTSFRLDLRQFSETARAEVSYHLYDQSEHLVKSESLSLNETPSFYEHLIEDPSRLLNDAKSYYFNIPQEITKIVIESNEDVWLTAYSRPSGLAQYIEYPYQQLNATQQKNTLPAWFLMRPGEWKKLIADGRSTLISVQPRAPEIDPMVIAGQYKWQQFLPDGDWRGRELLSAFDEDMPSSEIGKINQYQKIKPDLTLPISIEGFAGEPSAKPHFIFLQDNPQELNIKVWIDNILILDEIQYSKDGELILPEISTGEHELRVSTSKESSVLMDHIKIAGDNLESYTKKIAMKLEANTLTFSVKKEKDEEILALRIYAHKISTSNNKVKGNQEQKIHLSIKQQKNKEIGPFDSWTIMDRDYLLKESEGDSPRILNSTEPELGAARLLIINLGKDLPNGQLYQINIKKIQGNTGYIVFSRTQPGLYENHLMKNLGDAL